LVTFRDTKKSCGHLVGEGQRARDAEKLGASVVGGNSLEGERDTSGDIRWNLNAVGHSVDIGGNGARGAVAKSSAQISGLVVDVDTPYDPKRIHINWLAWQV
jgi:hypothetical protein